MPFYVTRLQVLHGGIMLASVPDVAPISDSATIDVAVQALNAVHLEIAPATIASSRQFGDCDEIVVESSIPEGHSSFATFASIGVPAVLTAVAGPLTVTGSLGATDSTGVNPPGSRNSIAFPVLSLTELVDASPRLETDSATIDSIGGTPFGHPDEHLSVVRN